MCRVVVIGFGMVILFVCGVEEIWIWFLVGEFGVGLIIWFDVLGVVMKYVCEIFLGDGINGMFNFDDWMELKDRCKVDDFILYGMVVV